MNFVNPKEAAVSQTFRPVAATSFLLYRASCTADLARKGCGAPPSLQAK